MSPVSEFRKEEIPAELKQIEHDEDVLRFCMPVNQEAGPVASQIRIGFTQGRVQSLRAHRLRRRSGQFLNQLFRRFFRLCQGNRVHLKNGGDN